ncbi:hypothetical protein [Methylobacterium sp. A54F]
MARGIGRTGQARAVIAVIALYALTMQALLGGLLPVLHAGPGALICLGPAGDPPPEGPAHPIDCCTAAQPAGSAAAPRPGAVPLARARRSAEPVAWISAGGLPARGPPRFIAHPRGPPNA